MGGSWGVGQPERDFTAPTRKLAFGNVPERRPDPQRYTDERRGDGDEWPDWRGNTDPDDERQDWRGTTGGEERQDTRSERRSDRPRRSNGRG